jgi:hypothetical protein
MHFPLENEAGRFNVNIYRALNRFLDELGNDLATVLISARRGVLHVK